MIHTPSEADQAKAASLLAEYEARKAKFIYLIGTVEEHNKIIAGLAGSRGIEIVIKEAMVMWIRLQNKEGCEGEVAVLDIAIEQLARIGLELLEKEGPESVEDYLVRAVEETKKL